MGHLHDALSRAYDVLGFSRAAGGDEVFRLLALARIIEPTSKLGALGVLENEVSPSDKSWHHWPGYAFGNLGRDSR